MRKYQMIHPVGREMVDLRTFEAEIKNAVAEIMPFAKVEVAANYYTVEPSPYHSQAIKIGQILGKIATLRQYSIQITRTFCSVEVLEEVEQQTTDASTTTIESKPIQTQKGGGGRGRKKKYIDINEMIRDYLPMSRKKARKFVLSYLNTKRIGNKIYVDREELEQILANPDIEKYPLYQN